MFGLQLKQIKNIYIFFAVFDEQLLLWIRGLIEIQYWLRQNEDDKGFYSYAALSEKLFSLNINPKFEGSHDYVPSKPSLMSKNSYGLTARQIDGKLISRGGRPSAKTDKKHLHLFCSLWWAAPTMDSWARWNALLTEATEVYWLSISIWLHCDSRPLWLWRKALTDLRSPRDLYTTGPKLLWSGILLKRFFRLCRFFWVRISSVNSKLDERLLLEFIKM